MSFIYELKSIAMGFLGSLIGIYFENSVFGLSLFVFSVLLLAYAMKKIENKEQSIAEKKAIALAKAEARAKAIAKSRDNENHFL